MSKNNEKFLEKISKGKVKVAPNGTVGIVEQTVGGNVIFREPTSDVIGELSKVPIEQDYIKSSLDMFFTNKIWPIRFVKKGILDKFYEISVPAAIAGDPTSDLVISDFNKVPEIVIEETFELTKADINQYDYQIYDSELADFATSADRAISVLYTLATAKGRAFGKTNQGKVLTAIFNNVTETVEFSGLTIEDKQKLIDQTFTKYGSESETLITETVNGEDYTFDTQFNQDEFIGIFNKSFSAEYKIDFFRNSFQVGNNSGATFNLKNIVVRDFSTTLGFPEFADADGTLPIANAEIVLVHKDAIDNLGQFQLGKYMGTLKAYSKGREYMKNNAFKVKGKPIIMFYSTGETPPDPVDEPTASLSNIVPQDPTTIGGTDGSITFDVTIANFVGSPTATLSPTSGTTPLTLTDGENSGLTFEDLPAGDYTITIKDGTTTVGTPGSATLVDPEA